MPEAGDPEVDRRDDRLLAPTRWVSTAIIPVLSGAFVLLYLFPGSTMRLWSWMVCPDMNALVMGGGYLAGAYLFVAVRKAREWHRVAACFVAVTVFASLLMVTTILHWELFNHDHPAFWLWLLLYATTPVLIPWLWLTNRRTDPGTPSAVDAEVPGGVRLAAGIGGLAQLGVATLLFGWPHVAARYWPWELDAATARALAAFVAFPAVTWAWFLVDGRWTSFRVSQRVSTLGLVTIGLGAIRASGDLRTDGLYTPVFAMALVAAIVLNLVLHAVMDRRMAPTADMPMSVRFMS